MMMERFIQKWRLCLIQAKLPESWAKRFTQDLFLQRSKLKDMRKSICNSLKHLGAPLYSSCTHFIRELIQNAEDNSYNVSSEGLIQVRIGSGFIINFEQRTWIEFQRYELSL